ncbi:MAG: ATP-binding protein [Pseudomonadota bacterium]
MSKPQPALWRRERLGLSMIAAALIVIVALSALLLNALLQQREARMRDQGVELLRVLGALSLAELAPESGRSAVLRGLSLRNDMAYATITATNGQTVAESTGTGVIVPDWTPPSGPSEWFGERTISSSANRDTMVEFFAPLLTDGELAAHLRIGYRKATLASLLDRSNLPLLATLAFIVFLLVPAFYFLVRREVRPLAVAAKQLDQAISEQRMPTFDINPNGEFGQFVARFNQFVEYANARVAQVESENERVITSTKLLSYRKDRVLRVLESLPDAVLVMNDSGGISVANQRLESLLGVDVPTQSTDQSYDWCTQPIVRQFLSQCRHRATRRYLPDPMEFRLDDREGQTFTVSAYPIFAGKEGASSGCVVLIRDTTQQTIARSSRAEFVAHVAHELKTPLNVLSMYSEALQTADPDDNETIVEASNVIEDEVKRLSALISNMLSLTKIEMGSMDLDKRRVRVNDLLSDAFDVARHSRGADELEFKLDLPSTLGALDVDKDLLRIVLNNLLSNAVKYNDPGGTVTLRARETDTELVIDVSDTGIGIGPDDLANVFEKFYRSDSDDVRDRSGHGLGLALARDIVELHNGTLTVSSEIGSGTTFTLTLFRHMHEVRDVG